MNIVQFGAILGIVSLSYFDYNNNNESIRIYWLFTMYYV